MIRPAPTPCAAGLCARRPERTIPIVDKSATARAFYSQAQLATYRMRRPGSPVARGK